MSRKEELWVFIEQDSGELEETSLGVLSKGRELADKYGLDCVAVILGEDLEDKARELGKYGATRIIVLEHPIFRHYLGEAYAKALRKLIVERNPNTIIFSATQNGVDLAGRLAVMFRTGLIAHVTTLDFDDRGSLIGTVPGFGGNIVALVRCAKGRPQLATVAPGIFTPEEFPDKEVNIEKIEFQISEGELKSKIIRREIREIIDISRSKIVVIAGMGTSGNLELVKQIAEVLRADIGVTRPIVDMGLAPRDLLVGVSGVSLHANLALILGVSGAPHFVSGIRDVKTVISVNIDPNAPILEHSDYYIVGDVLEIIPRVVEELRR